MESLEKVLTFIDSLSEWTGKAVSFLIAVLALVVGYEVVMRYAFDRPTVWVHEASAMLFGTFIIIGGAHTLRYSGHVPMDMIYNKFSKRGKAIMDVITFFLLMLPFVGILIWKGADAAYGSTLILERDSTQWGPPIYPFKWMLPIGAFLLFLQAMAKLVRDLVIVFKGDQGA
jgi:TRAP-type mannitol/chloroaromatic compound transport system permease small subunit